MAVHPILCEEGRRHRPEKASMRNALSFLAAVLIMPLGLRAETGSYSDFLYLSDEMVYFADGTVMDGPVRSNGQMRLVSFTPGRENDPWFYSLSTALDSIYTRLPGSPDWYGSILPHPEDSYLWVEPYELMEQGPPWFNLGVDEIPFGPDQVDWQSVRQTAMDYGYYFPPDSLDSGTRIVFDASRITVKETPSSETRTYCTFEVPEPVIWIDNAPGEDIYIRSVPPDSGTMIFVPMTLGCNGDVYLFGDLRYEPDTDGMLGVISSQGDLVIADTPPEDPWNGMFATQTDQDLICSGSFLLAGGELYAQQPWEPYPYSSLSLQGAIQLVSQGITAYVSPSDTTGYIPDHQFDERFFTQAPPFYPGYDTGTGVEDFGGELPEAGLFRAWPNPFGSRLTVCLSSSSAGSHTLMLMDVCGRRVESCPITDSRTLDTSELPPGVYLLVVRAPGGSTEARRVLRL